MKIPLHLLPKTIAFILLMFCFSHLALAQQTRYVTPSGAGAKTGADWANASDRLQDMINGVGTSRVFVAIGTYKIAPADGFRMKNNVAIYGGFDPATGITELSHTRILPTATGAGSILHGEDRRSVIKNDFTVEAPLTHTAILDGFTLTKGSSDRGGGMYNNYASPTVSNSIISDNTTTNFGGGIYNYYSSPIFKQVIITNNITNNLGGGVFNDNSSSVFVNVTTIGNTARVGQAVFNSSSANIKIINSIIFGTSENLNLVNISYSLAEGINSTVNNNIDATGITPADVFLNVNSQFHNGLRLKIGSPALDKGNNAEVTTNIDLLGLPRVRNSNVDLGAYEYQDGNTVTVVSPQNNIVYVKEGGSGTGNSWDNAIGDLNTVLTSTNTAIEKVFVAVGTYIAQSGGFTMKNNVAIYGGFNPADGITELSHTRILPTATGGGSVLSGNNANRVIYNNFTAASPLTGTAILDGFTITKGNSNYGGGMYNNYASPNVSNCAIIDNIASVTNEDVYGGGVYNDNSDPIFTHVLIKDNSAIATLTNDIASGYSYGGGVYNQNSSPLFSHVTVKGNNATITASATIAAYIFSYGGGVYNSSSKPVFAHVTITDNTSTAAANASTNAVYSYGGGVYNNYSSSVFDNVLITSNTTYGNAGTSGGGVFNANSSPVFKSTTITGNVADVGEATYNEASSNAKIVNSIVLGASVDLNLVDISYSLVQDINNTTNNNIDATGITPTMVFANAANPAGADGIFGTADDGLALKIGSPALDKGNNAEVTTNIDMAGLPRVRNSNVDLGAYEYQNGNTTTLVYVKEGSSGTGDSWDDALGNLDAISAPDNGDTKRVFVAVGTYIAPSGGFKMNNNVAIYGGFDPASGITNLTHARILPKALGGGSILSGNNANRVIYNNFTAASPLTGTAILDGFTLTKGNSNYGGGMYNNYASPNVSNCAIIDNIAATTNAVDAVGGGVSNAFSSPVFTNVLIANNKASAATASYAVGGGVYNRDASNPIFTNVLITGNEVDASTEQGGGIYNRDGSNPAFTNVTIAGNIAATGSEMYNHTSGTYSLNIKNSIIIGAGASGVSNLTPANVSYSLVQGINNTVNNNIDATSITPTTVFANVTNPAGADGLFGTADDGLALTNSSPALNKGDKTLYIDLTANTKDLAGNPRVYDFANGGQIDLGAYEFQGMPSVLPVQFGSFNVTKQNNSAKLQWNTLSESNNKEFIISRSNDGLTFTELARINGSGTINSTQNYLYLDSNPLNGINYYRLQQVDTDGKIEVLGEKTLSFSFSSLSLAAYPNPARNLVNLDFTLGRFNQLQVTDLSGRILQTLSLKPTDRNAIVDLGSSPIGIYVLSLTGANGTENIKVIKR